MSKIARNATLLAGLVMTVLAPPSQATVIQFASGLSSANVPVSFESHLTISGNILTIQLINNSPVASLNPNDVLGSYYFDIVDGGNNRPALSYLTAIGDVYTGLANQPDVLTTANANLKALVAGDNTWQYKVFNPTFAPMLGFGIGTVGNSNLSPNNFMGNIVDGIDFSIYKGDVTTANLNNKLLVKETATFTFSGVSGFTEADIRPNFAFGLGTAPDSTIPEPATAMLLALGAVGLIRRRR